MEVKKEELDYFPVKTQIDLESSCRICLLADSEMMLIFDQKHNFNGITIAAMINECSPCKALRFDEFPQQICAKCVEKLKIAYSFRRSCEESHSIISAYLNGGIEPSVTDSKYIPALDKSTQTEDNSFFLCEKCDAKFHSMDELRLHRFYKHRGTKNECRICKKSFRRIGYLKGHYSMYHPELGFNEKIDCDVCGKSFEKKNSLRRHVQKVHKISLEPKPINGDITISSQRSEIKDTENKSNINKRTQSKVLKKDHQTKCNKKSQINLRTTRNKKPELNVIKNKKKSESNPKTSKNNKSEINLIKNQKKSDINPITTNVSSGIIESKNSVNGSSEDDLPISILQANKNQIESDFPDNMSTTCQESESESEDDMAPFKDKVTDPKSNSSLLNIELNKEKIENNQVETESNIDPEGLTENAPDLKKIENVNTNLKQTTCTICLKVLKFPHHLKRHMLARHSNEKQFKCTICSSAFATPDYLKNHMKKCPINRSFPRSRIKKYDCKGCDEKFSSTRRLNSHTREKHPSIFKRVFACSYCPLSFETRHECTVHTNSIHENDKEYLCTECGQRFVRKRALEIHMRRHRGEKNHKCKFCGKGFVRAGDKDLHEKYHTGDKKFKCEICGQGFVRNYSLRVHMRIHTGEKPYRCETCPRSFAQSNDLKTHIRRDHTGERFICELNNCGETFLQLYLLNRHKKNVHGIHAPSHIQRVTKIYEVNAITEATSVT